MCWQGMVLVSWSGKVLQWHLLLLLLLLLYVRCGICGMILRGCLIDLVLGCEELSMVLIQMQVSRVIGKLLKMRSCIIVIGGGTGWQGSAYIILMGGTSMSIVCIKLLLTSRPSSQGIRSRIGCRIILYRDWNSC